jgi:hypothetical protein
LLREELEVAATAGLAVVVVEVGVSVGLEGVLNDSAGVLPVVVVVVVAVMVAVVVEVVVAGVAGAAMFSLLFGELHGPWTSGMGRCVLGQLCCFLAMYTYWRW